MTDVNANEPSAWVGRTCYLVARRDLKARPGSGQIRDASVDLPESVRDIVVAMRELSPNQRMAVLLHDYADRSTAEVDCSSSSINPRRYSAMSTNCTSSEV